MRTLFRVLLVGLSLGLAVCAVGAEERKKDEKKKDPAAGMDAAARAFLKAYHAKDLDALLDSADTPFLTGTFRDPKIFQAAADLRAELKSRLSADGKFPARVARTLTWDRAINSALGEERAKEMRERMKAAIDVTGPEGGYAALADEVRGSKGKRQLAVSKTRLLVGIRGGKAKVVGILMDESSGKR